MSDTLDTRMMARALEVARTGFLNISPDPHRGAIIAQGEHIVGEGYFAHKESQDPEIHALKAAGEQAQGATLYLILEPAYSLGEEGTVAQIVAAGIRRVVVALRDPNPNVNGRSIQKLKTAGLEVSEGLLSSEARHLNEFYLKDMLMRRPFVTMLSAMSLDGKMATSMHDSQEITSAPTREYVHQLRAQYDAVMIGINTVMHDNPQLSCKALRGRDPWRIVIDSQGRIPLNSKVFQRSHPGQPRPPVIVVTADDLPDERLNALRHAGAEVICCPDEESMGHDCYPRVDLDRLMLLLNRKNITSILLEGGGTLRAAALKAGIVDKVQFLVAPKIIGGAMAKSPVEGEGVSFVYEAIDVKSMQWRPLGSDLLIEGYISEL